MIEYILFFVGLVLLLKGADFLVDGSSGLARRFGIPSLFIGLTIVAFGTSLPELIVNLFASIAGKSDIALGNIVGSNIANILLILGISMSIKSISVKKSTVKYEMPFMIASALLLVLFASKLFIGWNPTLTRLNGIIMLLFFVAYLAYIVYMVIKGKEECETPKDHSYPLPKMALMILGGLVALYFGGRWVVDGATSFARLIGISEYIISATIVAVGTSLPELITSVVAIIKNEADISLGNIVGSNIFNVFLILGMSAVINPVHLSAIFDIFFNLFITVLLLLFSVMHHGGKKNHLTRWQGIIFLCLYVGYVAMLIIGR